MINDLYAIVASFICGSGGNYETVRMTGMVGNSARAFFLGKLRTVRFYLFGLCWRFSAPDLYGGETWPLSAESISHDWSLGSRIDHRAVRAKKGGGAARETSALIAPPVPVP